MINLNELEKVLREMFDAGRDFGWQEYEASEYEMGLSQTPEEAFDAALLEAGSK